MKASDSGEVEPERRTMPLEIRRYQQGDGDAVWDLHNLALTAVAAHAGNGAWDDDLHHITEVYLNDRGEFLVGTLDGRIVAMGALRRREDGAGQITRMRVHPEQQRQGFGRQILQRLLVRARELGYHRLVLDTTERQAAAIALYRSEAFTETGRGELAGMACIFFAKVLE